MMLLIEKLKDQSLTEQEKRIALYMIKQEERIKDMSVRDIAHEIYVAPSSIMRFSQKLGYSGFIAFKEAYLHEISYRQAHFHDIDANKPIEPTDRNMTIAAKMSALYKETIDDTFGLLQHDTLQTCINKLVKAQHIYICALGIQMQPALNFKDKMLRIGQEVIVFSTKEELYYTSMCAPLDSCFIFISYTGESKRPLQVLDYLIEKDIPNFGITTFGENSLSQKTTCLNVSTREKLTSSLGSFGFNLSVMYLLDVLYGAIFNSDYDKNYAYKCQKTKAFEKGEGRKTNNKLIQD